MNAGASRDAKPSSFKGNILLFCYILINSILTNIYIITISLNFQKI